MSDAEDGVVCGCCTRAVLDGRAPPGTPLPVLDDRVVGLCVACGRLAGGAEAWDRGRVQLRTFIEARIPLLADRLAGAARRSFLELPHKYQAHMVMEAVLDGLIP